MDKKGLFIVMAKVKPEAEEAFNRWYNEDHLPKALERFPGVVSGRRYQIMEGPEDFHRFVVIEFPTLEQAVACFESPEYQAAAAFRRNGGGTVENVIVEGGEATK